MRPLKTRATLLCLLSTTAIVPSNVTADEQSRPAVRVTFADDRGVSHVLDGRMIVEAADGGIVVAARDGKLWNITPDRLDQRRPLEEPFAPFSQDELAARLLEEFGPNFEIVTTRHYVICTSAGRNYGRWCGTLFERLLRAFQSHWKAAGLELTEPEFPLTAIVFATPAEFTAFATRDIGADSANTKGYYSIPSNRVVLFDLTHGSGRGPAKSADDITRRVEASAYNIATVVHEATHQIAFNSGMHTRYADNPLWLTEGMAMYFEMPDLRSRSGWRTIGRPNTARLRQFAEYLRADRRPADSLSTLIGSDDRFRDADLARDAYAESWALTYFLIKTRRDDYVAYLKQIAEKPPLIWDKPQQRLEDFQKHLGDLDTLNRELIHYIGRVSR